MHRHINIIYGYNTSYGKSKGDLVGEILKEGLQCLSDFCKESGVSLVELFERFDTDNSMSVTLQEFQDGLKVCFINSLAIGGFLQFFYFCIFCNRFFNISDFKFDAKCMLLAITLYTIDAQFDASMTDSFENIAGKEEIACNEQFLLFPQCFLLNQVIVSQLAIFLTSYLYLLLNWKSPKLAYEVK